jgi:predicted house-cleaning noncanonical NTP pyrophosphatase (MazG superfamily)
MPKLIRDKTKEFLEKRNPRVVFKRAQESQRMGLLYAKLLEEVGEYMTTVGREGALKELGDIQEIIWALGEMDDITSIEIWTQAQAKRNVRGSFDDLVTMEVEIDDEEPGPMVTPRGGGYGPDHRSLGDGPWYSG